jgi:hypothetical protein
MPGFRRAPVGAFLALPATPIAYQKPPIQRLPYAILGALLKY